MKKIILITGASSGMGKETAKVLAGQGHKVYAGARRLEKMKDLEPLGIVPIKMDVTKEEDNKRAIDTIIANEGRIDVLINNAGFGLYGPFEEIPLDDGRYQFDVNFFGLANLTQLVLPHMRAKKSGRVINISSMGGRIYTPFGAWYHATKHAIEGFSDCLRIETKPFGIDVIIVEPGMIKTDFGNVTGQWFSKYITKDSAYKSMTEPFVEMMNDPNMVNRGTEPIVLANTIANAATVENPNRRYMKGSGAKPMWYIRKIFGDGSFEWLLSRAFGGSRNQKQPTKPEISGDVITT
jgi:short-subunit dehydrogenase